MRLLKWVALPLTAVFTLVAGPSYAASVFLEPADSAASIGDGSTTLGLFMDFIGDPTVGGGVDFAVSGGLSIQSFTPSDYWNANVDSAFSGFGTEDADNDFEVHFGSFSGLSGLNKLGDFSIGLLSVGSGSIAVSINSTFGNFFSTDGPEQDVDLLGANVEVVPVPAALWLMISALGTLAVSRRRPK